MIKLLTVENEYRELVHTMLILSAFFPYRKQDIIPKQNLYDIIDEIGNFPL